MKVELTITRDDADLDIIADVTYHPACRGARDSCGGVRGAGPPLEPDEPASIDIDDVRDVFGNEIEPSARETEQILEAAWEIVNQEPE